MALVFGTTQVDAQSTVSKDINESWANIREINVEHRHGPLEVVPTSGNEVRLEATIKVVARERADAQTVLEHFNINRGASGGKLTLRTKIDTKNWVTNNGNTKITFKDGSRVTNIKDISITYKLLVPDVDKMHLTNKYDDIRITGDISGDLTVHMYDADVIVKNVGGDLDLDVKYGSAEVASARDANILIYDSHLELNKADKVVLNSKYSDYKIGAVSSLEMQTYDDEIEITEVTGVLNISDKYSDWKIGKAGPVTVKIHDSEFSLESAESFKGESKYSEYEIGKVGSIDLRTSYDDVFEVQEAYSLACTESKYSDYTIAKLSKSLVLTGYDDDIRVREISSGFDKCQLSVKYADVRLPLHTISGYQLEAETTYGSFDYPKPTNSGRHIEKSGKLEVSGTIGTPSNNARVTISAYSSDIRLN